MLGGNAMDRSATDAVRRAHQVGRGTRSRNSLRRTTSPHAPKALLIRWSSALSDASRGDRFSCAALGTARKASKERSVSQHGPMARQDRNERLRQM